MRIIFPLADNIPARGLTARTAMKQQGEDQMRLGGPRQSIRTNAGCGANCGASIVRNATNTPNKISSGTHATGSAGM
jgi:hypothetical protein